MTAERIMYASIDSQTYGEVLKHLSEGWKMDPFFHQTGRPWSIDSGHLWVLVKGSPEEVAELNPFVELPKPEITEDDQRTINKFEGIVDVVDIEPEALEDGRVAKLTTKGWEVFNILKGHVILVKRERNFKSPSSELEEAVEHELVDPREQYFKHAMCYLGVNRGEEGGFAKCDGSMPPHVPCKDWDKEKELCVWPDWALLQEEET